MSVHPKHVVILNHPHYGHIIPMLEFGKRLARFHRVTFAISEVRVDEMAARKMTGQEGENLRILGLRDGLTLADCNALEGVAFLVKVIEAVSDALRVLLDSSPPEDDLRFGPVDVVILDYFHFPAAKLCHSRKMPFYFFNTASAGLTLGILGVNRDTPTKPKEPSGKTGFFEKPIPGVAPKPMVEEVKELLLLLQEVVSLPNGLINNSTREMDAHAVNIMAKVPTLQGQKLWFVGPLMADSSATPAKSSVGHWLDTHSDATVIYVSFGSLIFPDPEELFQVGLALLATKKPFLLSLPSRHQVHLPKELLEPSSNHPATFLVENWVPQKEVLQHPALALFVSHCGWNSTLEAIFAGVPVVGWPLFGDQKINAEWFRDHAAGELIEGTGLLRERLIPASEIAAVISKVADLEREDGNRAYRKAMLSWKEKVTSAIAAGGSSDKDFVELVSAI